MQPTDELLAISESWPERRLGPGDILFTEGGQGDQLCVLVDGALSVRRGDDQVATIDQPGACIGESALLLEHQHTATVVATTASLIRVLDDAGPMLATDASLLLPVASILAGRLRLVNAYLTDLRHQYADTDHGLGMVSEVLGSLAAHHGSPVEPGSEREPDAPY